MIRILLALFAFSLPTFSLPAFAETSPLAGYYTGVDGGLPPEYTWSTRLNMYADGRLILEHCKGADPCFTRTAKVGAADIAAISDAITASGLIENPPTEPEPGVPMVGGDGSVDFSGAIWVSGQKVWLRPGVIAADRPRVALVNDAIRAAIPQSLQKFLRAN